MRHDSEPVDDDEPEEVMNEEEADSSSSDPADDNESEDQDSSSSEGNDDETSSDDGVTVPDSREDDSDTSNEDEPEEIEEESYPLDTRVEEIYVDDDLTIRIADGIGSRKLIDMPDILILSDKSGEVVVDVCVDRLGRVVSNSLNEDMSTLKTASLVSLALRESSNFRFARSSRKNHCGTITFVITSSN